MAPRDESLHWVCPGDADQNAIRAIIDDIKKEDDAMRWWYDTCVGTIHAVAELRGLAVENVIVTLAAICKDIKVNESHAMGNFLAKKNLDWDRIRMFTDPLGYIKAKKSFAGFWTYILRKPLYDYAVNAGTLAPVLLMRDGWVTLGQVNPDQPASFDIFADTFRYESADFEMDELSAQQQEEICYDRVAQQFAAMDAMKEEPGEFEQMAELQELRW